MKIKSLIILKKKLILSLLVLKTKLSMQTKKDSVRNPHFKLLSHFVFLKKIFCSQFLVADQFNGVRQKDQNCTTTMIQKVMKIIVLNAKNLLTES